MSSEQTGRHFEIRIYVYSTMIASPGGTTEAALIVFKEGKISEPITAAITRARERSRELAK